MRIFATLIGAVMMVSASAYSNTLHVSCRALTPWNGGSPAKSSFSMFIDIDPAKKVVRFQPDVDLCCQTFGAGVEANGDKRTVSFALNQVVFGTIASGRPPDLYTFDIASGALTHDFGYASSGGADRRIISTYQCIDVQSN